MLVCDQEADGENEAVSNKEVVEDAGPGIRRCAQATSKRSKVVHYSINFRPSRWRLSRSHNIRAQHFKQLLKFQTAALFQTPSWTAGAVMMTTIVRDETGGGRAMPD